MECFKVILYKNERNLCQDKQAKANKKVQPLILYRLGYGIYFICVKIEKNKDSRKEHFLSKKINYKYFYRNGLYCSSPNREPYLVHGLIFVFLSEKLFFQKT